MEFLRRIPEFQPASSGVTGYGGRAPSPPYMHVRGRVPNNRLPFSLGMLRTVARNRGAGLQIVPTLRAAPCRAAAAVVKKFPRGPPPTRTGILSGRRIREDSSTTTIFLSGATYRVSISASGTTRVLRIDRINGCKRTLDTG